MPDYITSVKEGGFYGWPWFYIGKHEDPRAKADFDGKDKETLPRQADKTIDKVIVPDVLIQAHSASLGLHSMTACSSRPNIAAISSPASTVPGTGADVRA